jgi:choice-of-anchor B domain-containing protein
MPKSLQLTLHLKFSLIIYMKLKVLFLALVSSSIISAQTPCVNGMAGSYPCSNVDLLSFVPLSAMGGGENTNDIWGWVSPNTGKEYALVGCHNGTAFLDISDPVEPVYLGRLPSHTSNNLWRDLETYKNYCFIGSEASGHGLQVFDLTQLDNVQTIPTTFQETAHYAGFGNSHTIAIDTLNGYLYANGTNTYAGGLHIVNITNPLQPTLAGGFALEGYTHDCFIWNYDGPDTEHLGKQIVFACNGTKLAVVDCTERTNVTFCSMTNWMNKVLLTMVFLMVPVRTFSKSLIWTISPMKDIMRLTMLQSITTFT